MNFTLRVDKRTGEASAHEFRVTVPPKESVAYALALIRPLTLKSDKLAFGKVLAALDAFRPKDDDRSKGAIEELQLAWESYPARRMRIMKAPLNPSAEGVRVDAWDNEIARAYLYGQLVHGDDNAELLDALSDKQVVFAASAMVADGFKLVNNTYEILHWLRPDIAPEHAFFTARVAAAQESES